MTHPITELELYRVLVALERVSVPVQGAVLHLIDQLDIASEEMVVSPHAVVRQTGGSLRKVLFSLNRKSWKKT